MQLSLSTRNPRLETLDPKRIRPLTQKVSIIVLAFIILLVCGTYACNEPPPPGNSLSDHQFSDLVWEVVQLQKRYASHPDSLAAEKEKLYKRFGVTRDILEFAIEGRKGWEEILKDLEKKLRAESEKKARGSADSTWTH